VIAAALVSLTASVTPARAQAPQTTVSRSEQSSGTKALLQAVRAVDTAVVWVSGHEGTVLRTLDGGRHWEARPVPGADTLQFRDVEAFGADTAWVLSAGTGQLSRIYRTIDGGAHWTLQFRNENPRAFFDCLAFWDSRRGLAFSDAVAGHFIVLRTTDGGKRWKPVAEDSLPPARDGEASFAASGTCVTTGEGGRAWIGLGGVQPARVLYTEDDGRHWSVAETPIVGGPTAGITSVAFWDASHGLAFGGDVSELEERGDHVAATNDGGRTWTVGGRTRLKGPVYGGVVIPASTPGKSSAGGRAFAAGSSSATGAAFAVGPGGADYSLDRGASWQTANDASYWSVAFNSAGAGWAVGPEGRITRFSFESSAGDEDPAPDGALRPMGAGAPHRGKPTRSP